MMIDPLAAGLFIVGLTIGVVTAQAVRARQEYDQEAQDRAHDDC